MTTQKKILAAITIAIAIALIAGGIVWQRAKSHPAGHVEGEQASLYYCPMHPTVTSDKPGNCPICGISHGADLGQSVGQPMRELHHG